MNSKAILLVDDEDLVLSALSRMLRKENYAVLTAKGGEEGLMILEQNEVQLVISDYLMPGMDGIQFLSKVKDRYPEIMRIILTGNSDLKIVISAINEGEVYRYLTKPLEHDELIAVIRQCFANYDMAREVEELSLMTQRQNYKLALINQNLSHSLDEVSKLNSNLKRSNEELEQFAYVASHDLREPLRKITSFSDRLTSKYADVLDEQGCNYLNRMRDAACRMDRLINDLMSLSRLTTATIPFVPVDLNRVVKTVLSDLEAGIAELNASIEVDDLATIDADPVQIQMLLQNLIGNALKFHVPGQSPVIRVGGNFIIQEHDVPKEDLNQKYEITVQDNGIGFDEEKIDRIFVIFQRLHSREQYEGTGIGLALCKKIVERHQGQITVQSKPGCGSCFRVTLPVKQIKEGDEECVKEEAIMLS
ncbi:MAG: ATP-binding protein [bacterium]